VVNERTVRVPVINLFREGRGLGTTMLWVINFHEPPELYFLGSGSYRGARCGYTRRLQCWWVQRCKLADPSHHPEWLDDQPFGFRRVLTIVFGVATLVSR